MLPLRWYLILALAALLPAAAYPYVLVNAESLTLRAEPDAKAKAITKLENYQPVDVLERKGDQWAKVKTRDGQTGWVLNSYLTRTPYISSDQDKLNARQGWGTEYPVLVEYTPKFPLLVKERASNGWLLVKDVDGDGGWVNPKMIKTRPQYIVTTREKCNLRSGPNTEAGVTFTSAKGVIYEVLEEKDGWLRVKHTDGDEGWVSAKIVYGWLDPEEIKDKPAEKPVKKDTAKKESAKKETAKSGAKELTAKSAMAKTGGKTSGESAKARTPAPKPSGRKSATAQ